MDFWLMIIAAILALGFYSVNDRLKYIDQLLNILISNTDKDKGSTVALDISHIADTLDRAFPKEKR
jgi:hypothetical protein